MAKKENLVIYADIEPAFEKKKDKKKKKKKQSKRLLLNSIAAYLETNGFSDTLSVFRTEAKLEDGDAKGTTFNLEDIFCKFLASKEIDQEVKSTVALSNGSCDLIDASSKASEKELGVPQLEPKETKKRPATEHESQETSEVSGAMNLNQKPEGTKSKKKTKMFYGDTLMKESQQAVDNNSTKLVSLGDDSRNLCELSKDVAKNDKDKKKKNHKKESRLTGGLSEGNDLGEVRDLVMQKVEELHSLLNNSDNVAVDTSIKNEDGKRKKKKHVSDTAIDSVEQLIPNDSKSLSEEAHGKLAADSNTQKNADGNRKKTSNKRKRLLSEEQGLQVDMVAEINNKMKSDTADGSNNSSIAQGGATSLQGDQSQPSSKKRKTDNNEVNGNVHHGNLNSTPSWSEVEGNEMMNAKDGLNGRSGGAFVKGNKKENHSAEPKSVNAFKRVKVDAVEFADERLQDNSYWGKDGADSGYGAKAQEVLGQVKGRDFRHEKTKKKRGSYRGGQIDLASHSIKFSYSDDE